MKEETKGLIIWIKKQINFAKETWIAPVHKDGYPEYEADYNKAMNFLDSLPEIESHLCRGGYIQDKNGTPCCDGDKVLVLVQNFVGVLRWDVHNKMFVVTDDTDSSWTLGSWNIEKVEE